MEVARIPARRDTARVKKDLRALCAIARDQGAADARILGARDLAAALRAGQEKGCVVSAEEQSIHWPETIYPNDDITEAITRYQWAIVFRVDVDRYDEGDQKKLVPGTARWQAAEKIFGIAAGVESQCFYKGYHLALGLAATNCRDIYCHEERRCWAMIKGRACIHPFKARPPLDACGLDPLVLAQRAGWTSSSDGSGTRAQPGFLVGLVLVL